MPLVKYIGNADSFDGTTQLLFDNDKETGAARVLVLGGEALEITGKELQQIQGRYQLAEIDSEGNVVSDSSSSDTPKSAAPASSPEPSAPAGSPVSPAPSSQPAASSSPSNSPAQGN